MADKNISQLEKSVENQYNSKSGHVEFMLLFAGLGAASLIGSFESGYRVATGQNVGAVMPSLSAIIPLAGATAGYKFPHLSVKDPFAKDCKIPNPLKNGARYLSICLAVQAVSFGVGYSLGYFSR